MNVSDDEDSLKSNLDGESGADGKVSLKSNSFDQAGVDGDGAEPARVADAALQAGVHLTLGAAVAEIRSLRFVVERRGAAGGERACSKGVSDVGGGLAGVEEPPGNGELEGRRLNATSPP